MAASPQAARALGSGGGSVAAIGESGSPVTPMNPLKLIGLTLVQLGKQIGLLPQTIRKALQQRKLQAGVEAREVERLDRIRNPSKYRGKEI